MKSLDPVQGWKAEKVLCENSYTYNVIRCPNFTPARKEKTKHKRSWSRPGIKIRIVETGQVFDSIRQCAREINVSESYVSQCLHARVKSVLGLHFENVKNCE